MVSDEGQALLVGRLSGDRELARQAAFALFVRVFLEQAGLLPRRLGPTGDVAGLPEAIAEVWAANPHVVASFADPRRRAALATLDPAATRELLGWLGAQRMHQEEPQVAYELGMLALGVELPAIVVRGLRELPLEARSRVAELPDGSGYPTVFLATLHPAWRAAGGACLFVSGGDAEQLAGWAMLLLARSLAPPAGAIRRVEPGAGLPLSPEPFDVAVVYNPAPWLPAAADYGRAITARHVALV